MDILWYFFIQQNKYFSSTYAPHFQGLFFFSPINLRKVESQLMFLQTTHLLSTYEIGFMQEAPR